MGGRISNQQSNWVTISQISIQNMQVLMVPFAVIPICSLRDSWSLLKILVLEVLDCDLRTSYRYLNRGGGLYARTMDLLPQSSRSA